MKTFIFTAVMAIAIAAPATAQLAGLTQSEAQYLRSFYRYLDFVGEDELALELRVDEEAEVAVLRGGRAICGALGRGVPLERVREIFYEDSQYDRLLPPAQVQNRKDAMMTSALTNLCPQDS